MLRGALDLGGKGGASHAQSAGRAGVRYLKATAYPKLRVMEKTVCCLLRAYKLYERAAHRKVRSSIARANQGARHVNRAAVATAVYNMLTPYLLVYMGCTCWCTWDGW